MRRLTSVLGIAAALLLAALGVSGCASANAASSLSITAAYVPQPTTPGMTVAYLDIRNNGHADRLLGVHTSVGGTVQLRAPGVRHAGTLTMHTVAYIPIAADALTQLNPDSYHLLITGAGPMHDGKDIMLKLTFADAGTITVIALVTNPQTGGSSCFLNLATAPTVGPLSGVRSVLNAGCHSGRLTRPGSTRSKPLNRSRIWARDRSVKGIRAPA